MPEALEFGGHISGEGLELRAAMRFARGQHERHGVIDDIRQTRQADAHIFREPVIGKRRNIASEPASGEFAGLQPESHLRERAQSPIVRADFEKPAGRMRAGAVVSGARLRGVECFAVAVDLEIEGGCRLELAPVVRAVDEFAPVPGHGMNGAREPGGRSDDDLRTPERRANDGVPGRRSVSAATGARNRPERGDEQANKEAMERHI